MWIPTLGQSPGRLGSDPPQRVRAFVAQHGQPVVARQPVDSAGLTEPGGHLRAQFGVPDPDRAGQPRLGQHGPLDLDRQRLRIAGESAEERLVPTPYLDPRGQPAQRRHDLVGCLLVCRAVGWQEDRIRASPRRRPQRHAGANAEPARLVRGGGDDHSRLGWITGTSDDHRPTAQLRPAPYLDRGEELVQVDMENPGVWRRHDHAILVAPRRSPGPAVSCDDLALPVVILDLQPWGDDKSKITLRCGPGSVRVPRSARRGGDHRFGREFPEVGQLHGGQRERVRRRAERPRAEWR